MRCTSGLRHWSKKASNPSWRIRIGSVSPPAAAACSTCAVSSSSTCSKVAWNRSVLLGKWWYSAPRLTAASLRISSVDVAAKPLPRRGAGGGDQPAAGGLGAFCLRGHGESLTPSLQTDSWYVKFTHDPPDEDRHRTTRPHTAPTLLPRRTIRLSQGDVAYVDHGDGDGRAGRTVRPRRARQCRHLAQRDLGCGRHASLHRPRSARPRRDTGPGGRRRRPVPQRAGRHARRAVRAPRARRRSTWWPTTRVAPWRRSSRPATRERSAR